MKRVLHVTGAMNMGGTETMLMNLYRKIDKSKVQFDFISYSQEPACYDAEIESLGGRIFRLHKTQSIRELMNIIQEKGPYAAIHAHTLFHCGTVLVAAKLSHVPIRIAHAHTTQDSQNSLPKKLYIQIMRTIIQTQATKLLYCSEAAGAYLYGSKALTSKKSAYFGNVIEYDRFLQVDEQVVETFKAEYQLQNKFVIGHVGRFIEAKNHRFMIDVLNELVKQQANVVMMFVGDGDTKAEMQQLISEKRLDEYVRFVPIRRDVEVAFQAMDVFLFPSIYEGLGLVMIEAQVSNLPCVISKAIPNEADLGVGLVNSLELNAPIQAWCQALIAAKTRQHPSKQRIHEACQQKGYFIESGMRQLEKLYGVKE
ncbi:MAG: glycosyltransferase family 1 protein [Culicoidibacterales bacterium]